MTVYGDLEEEATRSLLSTIEWVVWKAEARRNAIIAVASITTMILYVRNQCLWSLSSGNVALFHVTAR